LVNQEGEQGKTDYMTGVVGKVHEDQCLGNVLNLEGDD
jgi:hypothetical protein